MVDFIRPTPRNPFLGLLADAATKARDATGAVGDLLLGGAPETLDNASYGVSPVQFGETRNGLMGAVNGMQVDPGVADVAGLLSGVPGVVRGGQFVGREALRAVDDGMMGRGLLSKPLSGVAPNFMLEGRYRHPALGDRVPVNVTPDPNVRLAQLQVQDNTPTLRVNPIFMSDKAWITDRGMPNAANDFLWPFGDDVYIRNSSPQDYKYLTSGTHRGSINHATGEAEGGLSVTRGMAYPSDTAYLVRGKRIGDGSDGEPLLGMDSVSAVTKPMTPEDMQDYFLKQRAARMQQLGLDDADVRALKAGAELRYP